MKLFTQYATLLLFMFCTINTMEKPEQTQRSWLEQLPAEINQHILVELTSAKTLDEAVKNIKNFLISNKSFSAFLNDPQTNKLLIEKLAQQFTNGDHIAAAIALNTPGAAEYIASQIKTDQDARKLGEILIDAVTNYAAEYTLSRTKTDQYAQELNRMLIDAIKNQNPQKTINFLLKVQQHSKLSFINAQDAKGNTALILAARFGHTKIVQQLLEAGADVNKQNNRKRDTALMEAVSSQCPVMVQQLLKAGADVNKQSFWGDTALMYAALHSVELVQLLLEAGADVNIKNSEGRTALQHAHPYDKPIIDLLRKAGARE